MEYIKNNYELILKTIGESVQKVNKNINDITFVAVTKNVDIERMEYAKSLGITQFGENRVQELLTKYEHFGNSVKWHLIGHLQKNKVKYIIDKVDLIHSVDSLELAREIDKRAKAVDKIQKILIQINIANDEAKFGLEKNEVSEVIKEVAKLNNVEICGFMTIVPYTENVALRRTFFEEMYKTSIDNWAFLVHNECKLILSMGMTTDYKEAIESNSNLVRIGTGLFEKE